MLTEMLMLMLMVMVMVMVMEIELNKMNERIAIAMLQWENELHLIIPETSTIDSLERQKKNPKTKHIIIG